MMNENDDTRVDLSISKMLQRWGLYIINGAAFGALFFIFALVVVGLLSVLVVWLLQVLPSLCC
jgi:hypothetical protein